jgi:hypothetical protein
MDLIEGRFPMPAQDANSWNKATEARNRLQDELRNRNDVDFVDIGYTKNDHEEITLRVHVDEHAETTGQASFPKDVDGIPVVVVRKGN